MFCSISGKPTIQPVLSPVSGHIFDQTLIENYVEQTGKDPINDQPLSVQDLIKINRVDPVISTPNNLTSIPNLLSQFQKEWDALAVELFTLRKQLKESREELSVLLYHNDAAVRVAAKLVRERDEARKALEELASSMAKGDYEKVVGEVDMEGKEEQQTEEQNGKEKLCISDEIAAEIKKAHLELFNEHKTNKKKPAFNSESTIQLSLVETFEFQTILDNLTGFKTAIITSVIPNPQDLKKLLISFDNDHCIIFDTESNTVVSKLTPKKKKLTCSNWLNNIPVMGFEDGSIVVEDKVIKSTEHLFKLITHPILPIILSIHQSGVYIFYENELIFKFDNLSFIPTCLDLHGDGVLLSVGGDDGCVYIYDISTGEQALKLNDLQQQDKKVKSLKFASNGYSLVGEFERIDSELSSKLKIFDLRKGLVTFEIDNVHFIGIDGSSHLIYLLKESDEKIELSYLRYFKKLKTWKLNDDAQDLFIDQVGKLKKKQTTHVVSAYESTDDTFVLVENSNLLQTVKVQVIST